MVFRWEQRDELLRLVSARDAPYLDDTLADQYQAAALLQFLTTTTTTGAFVHILWRQRFPLSFFRNYAF